jgi:hypothetical protein
MAIQENTQTIIDRHFFVPVGVVDVRQQNDADSEFSYSTADTAQDNNQPILQKPTDTIPMPPTSYQILGQRVRISADGTAVVDVTLEFPDIAGIDHIDVRVTKSA